MNDKGDEQSGLLFRNGLAQLGISLDEQIVDRLILYTRELVKWNRKVNLVAKNTSLEDIVEKHFLDSLTLIPVLAEHAPEKVQLLDVGSGAGFPGLVIKVACPGRQVVLLEPRQRRVSFLNHIIRLLKLSEIEVLANRTNEIQGTPDSNFSLITSRAVADVTAFLNMVTGLSSPGSLVVCMQGASGMEQWEREKDNPNFSRVGIKNIELPFSKSQRSILLFRRSPVSLS